MHILEEDTELMRGKKPPKKLKFLFTGNRRLRRFHRRRAVGFERGKKCEKISRGFWVYNKRAGLR